MHALIGGLADPEFGLVQVLFDAGAGFITAAELVLRLGIALFGCFAIPFHRLGIILFDTFSFVITAILISHAHTDHTAGCAVFSRKYDIPVYMMPETVLIMTCRET